MNKKKYTILVTLKILVAITLISVIISKVDMGEVWLGLKDANKALVAGAFILYFVGICVIAARWKVLLHAQGMRVGFVTLVKSMLVAVFFNNLLPSTIGGDAVRAYDTWRFGGGKTQSLSIVLIDRLLGVFTLCIFALLALLTANIEVRFIPNLDLWITLAVTVGFITIYILFFRAATMIRLLESMSYRYLDLILRPVRKVMAVFATYNGQPGVLFIALLLSFLLQFNVVMHYYLIALALDIVVPVSAMFIIIPVAIVVMMIPVTINAIGIREAIFVLLFGLYGVDAASALAFAWMSFVLVTLLGVIGGVVFMVRKHERVRGPELG